MPLVVDTPDTPPPKKPVPVQVAAPEFRGVTVDTRYQEARRLLTHVEGASWTVNYYSQVLGVDNALSGQSLDRPAAVQQYKLIQGYELKVTTPLNSTQDQTTKEFNITGQANFMPSGLIPNKGDMFIADVGDGREALFQVTESERRTIYLDAAYIVDYVLVSYSNQDDRINDLNTKVVENLYYDVRRMEDGQNPFISYSDKIKLGDLQGQYAEIVQFYFSRFFSKEYRTLLLPGQANTIYDPFLTHNVLAMFRDEAHPNIKLIRQLNVGEDDNFDTPNIWTALRYRRRKELIGSMRLAGVVSTRTFSLEPMFDSIRFSGLEYVVYPADPVKSEDYIRKDYSKPLAPLTIMPTLSRLTRLIDVVRIPALYGLPSYNGPAVTPVTADAYVFSQAFYQNERPGQSGLELLFQDYLDGKAMDLVTLNQLAQTYTSWSPLEQFYQLPFLLAMLRSSIRGM